MGAVAAGQAPTGGDLAALCSEQSGDVTNLPIAAHRAGGAADGAAAGRLQRLKQASREAAERLQASCPSEMPQTPLARLDAVETRLKAMLTR